VTGIGAEIAAEYYAQGHWRAEDLWTSFARRAEQCAAKDALICGEDRLSFEQLAESAARLGRGLQARGIGPGDVVIIHGRNGIEAVVTLLACAWLGAVMTPVPPMFSEAQLAAIADRAGARAVVCLGNAVEMARAIAGARQVESVQLILTGGDIRVGGAGDDVTPLAALLAEAPAALPERGPVGPDDLAMLVYSSGTTGTPKGVMHSANTVRYALETRAALHRVGPADTCLIVCQFGFVGSIVFGLLTGPLIGATSVILPTWNADEALALITRHRVSYGLFMPTHVHDLLNAPGLGQADLSSLWRAAMGGLSEDRRRDVMQRLCPLPLPGYGMSECLGNTTCSPEDPPEQRLSREGRPYPGTEMRIVSPEGQPCAPGEVGEIELRGPSRCLGYFRAPDINAAAFTPDGFFRSGDLGSLDASGYLTFAGREKDIIRRGGVTIVPGEVEVVLARHPMIGQVAIVALPDPRYGEIACACVIPQPGTAPLLEDLTGFLQAQGVARYQWPERVALFDDFPRTPSLKVQKPALVKALTAAAGGAIS
jgi:cyclohexanecarboxylate-CoA ligase